MIHIIWYYTFEIIDFTTCLVLENVKLLGSIFLTKPKIFLAYKNDLCWLNSINICIV